MDNILTDNNLVLDRFNPKYIASMMAKEVAAIRLGKNLTQAELAQQSGVSLGSLKRFEQKQEISLKNLLKLALVLGFLDRFEEIFQSTAHQSFEEIVTKKTRKRARHI